MFKIEEWRVKDEEWLMKGVGWSARGGGIGDTFKKKIQSGGIKKNCFLRFYFFEDFYLLINSYFYTQNVEETQVLG